MKPTTYDAEALTEATHWWYVGRRILFARVIENLGVSLGARVLDVGTSTGTNLRMLRENGFACVEGVDNSEEAISWCNAKGLGPVKHADACDLPYGDQTFDLVLATDVVEHVDDDAKALSEIHRILKRGACAVITVPAFGALWGSEDEASHHKRRYRGSEIRRLVDAAGFARDDAFYFNYLLFLPVFLSRALTRLSRSTRSDIDINSPWINRILTAIFRIDVATAPILKPPFGVSYLVVARRK